MEDEAGMNRVYEMAARQNRSYATLYREKGSRALTETRDDERRQGKEALPGKKDEASLRKGN